MDNLQKIVYKVVKMGGLNVKGKDGVIDILLILEEAIEKDILPREVLDKIGSGIEVK